MQAVDPSPARTTRVSSHIRRVPASNLHHAIRIAPKLGVPLNTFATITFTMTGCPVDEVSIRFARLRNTHFSHWARRPGRRTGFEPCPPTFAWVIEAGGGVTAAHWLVHIPDARRADFEARLPGWVTSVAGQMTAANAIDVRDAPTPKGVGRYMLKGIEPIYAEFYGIEAEDQGLVTGRRSGYSLNLGPTQKKRLRAEGRYPQAWRGRPFPPPPRPRPNGQATTV